MKSGGIFFCFCAAGLRSRSLLPSQSFREEADLSFDSAVTRVWSVKPVPDLQSLRQQQQLVFCQVLLSVTLPRPTTILLPGYLQGLNPSPIVGIDPANAPSKPFSTKRTIRDKFLSVLGKARVAQVTAVPFLHRACLDEKLYRG